MANINPIRYRSYYYDAETGFYYLQSRYYDPETGRFINADGVSGINNDINTYNLFLYCGNNPILCTDGTGCWTISLNKSVSLSLFLNVSFSWGIVIDSDFNIALQYSYNIPFVNDTAGIGLFGAGIDYQVQCTNANKVFDLEEAPTSVVGCAINTPAPLVYATANVISFSDIADSTKNDQINGVQGGIGVGVFVDFIHVTKPKTSTVYSINIRDIIFSKQIRATQNAIVRGIVAGGVARRMIK